ncbi:MAG: HEAT repeat domain-containing protein [Kangiellaceae bacterium]
MEKATINQSLSDKDISLLMDYINHELDEDEMASVEKRMLKDKVFFDAIAEQKSFNSLVPPRMAPVIDRERMSGVRWATHRALRNHSKKRVSFLSLVSQLWQAKISFRSQFASVLVAFGVGFMVSQTHLDNSNSAISDSTLLDSTMLPVTLIKNGDFEITDLSVDSIDSNSGAVKLTYSLASQTSLDGNIASRQIQGLLASTMRNDVSDDTRLQLIELLKGQTETSQMRDALSYSLLNDPNPGVRMAAAEVLVKNSHYSQVRNVLRQALKNDVNQGIRIQVFTALTQYSDEKETQEVFKDYSVNDSNRYIRELARVLVHSQNKAVANDSI